MKKTIRIQRVCGNCHHAEEDTVDLWCIKNDCPVFGNEKACSEFKFYWQDGDPLSYPSIFDPES